MDRQGPHVWMSGGATVLLDTSGHGRLARYLSATADALRESLARLASAMPSIPSGADGAQPWDVSSLGLTLDQSGALFLLLGGLAILAVVIPMTMLRMRFEVDRRDLPAPRRVVTGDEDDEDEASSPAPLLVRPGPPATDPRRRKGREEGARLAEGADTLDDVLDRIEARWAGRVRLTHSRPGAFTLVLRDRPAPERSRPDGDESHQGCQWTCGLLEASLTPVLRSPVTVTESSCTRAGDTQCRFEVNT